jgi:hypothetical protein
MNDVEGTMGDDGEVRVTIRHKEIVRRPRLNVTGDPKFLARLEEFVTALQGIINEHYRKNLANLTPPIITVQNGQKNVRIVRTQEGMTSDSVHCFINKENGDILKAAGWKAPAKHARGNIYVDLLKGVNVWGADYL